jgi:hypothetical protein
LIRLDLPELLSGLESARALLEAIEDRWGLPKEEAMNERQLALTLVLALAAAPVLAQGAHERGGGSSSSGSSGAADRHPGSSGGGSSSGTSFTPSSSSGDASSGTSYARPSSPPSGSSSSTSSRRGSAAERRHPSPRSGGSSRGAWTGGGRHDPWGGSGSYWVYRPYYGPYGWGYPYGGYYDGYYWGYYGWGAPYSSNHYVYNYDFGSLRLQVEPDDAEVYVDGYYAGEVDDFNGIFQRLHVRPGRHEIAFKRRGFRTHRVKVYVPVGSTLKVRYEMQPGQASDVTEAVIGAPDEMERADKARALPTLEGEDEEAIEDEPPASASGRPAEVRLAVKPADAAVYVDGRFLGNGEDVDELQLAPGKHRVEVVRPGFATFEKDIELTAGEGRDLKVELDKAGASQ